VSILDYGVGNLHSLAKALVAAGGDPHIVTDPARALDAEALVLPGVGAFPAAADRLASGRDALRASILGGFPTLGICLGMQLLFAESDEGPGAGLAVFDGRVERLQATCIPQIGWNAIEESREPLIEQAEVGTAYYANSFVCRPRDIGVVTSWSVHETDRFPATVRRGRTVGVQFHPEKSSAPGVALLRQFLMGAAA
jgi:glutamine amidotransferase